MARQLTELQRERKLYRQKVSRLEKRGYVFEQKLDKTASVQEYREFRENIYQKVVFVESAETGEVISGEEGRRAERKRSAAKARETRERKKREQERREEPPQPEERPEADREEYTENQYDLGDEETAHQFIQDFIDNVTLNHTTTSTQTVIDAVLQACNDYGSYSMVALNIADAKEDLIAAVQAYYEYAEAEEEASAMGRRSKARHYYRQAQKFLLDITNILHGGHQKQANYVHRNK